MNFRRERVAKPAGGSVYDLVKALHGPHFGIIEDLGYALPEPDDPPISICSAHLCRTSAFAAVEVPRRASGAGLDQETALGACVGEAVERYCAGLQRPGAVQMHRFKDIAREGNVVSPESFALFSRWQFLRPQPRLPFKRWTTSDRMGWVESESLTTGTRKLVPAQFVYQPYATAAGERLIAPGLSTGLAAGMDWTTAVVAGLCEVFERDAVALSWLGQVQPARLEEVREPGNSTLASLLDMLATGGWHWMPFDLSTDIPIFAVFLEGQSSIGPIFSFGAAGHPEPERAFTKALLEAAHARVYIKGLIREDPCWTAGSRFENVSSFAHHARFYSSHPEHSAPLNLWKHTPHRRRFQPSGPVHLREWIDTFVAALALKGFEILVVDLTTPDIEPLGLKVVRVLVPGLQPLHGHHAWPHLGGRRLRQLPEIFGTAVPTAFNLNRYPHPCA